MSGGRPTPRVLLADDHAEMRSHASSVLQETCDIVASVNDGLEAVEQTIRLNPDVVILDVTMPGLDGFQAARELRRRGSQAKVVFLSLHEGDEFVVTGIRSGGSAYVSKHRMPIDLPSAVEQVRAGRVFLPTLSSLSAITPRGGHALMFYARHEAWCSETAGLVRIALSRGDAVTVFASEVTRKGIAKKLAEQGLDTTQVIADGRYVVVDAAETLQAITRDGQPDEQLISAVVETLHSRLAVSRPASRMTIVGEIAAGVGPVQGDAAVLGIEKLWNTLAGDRPFLTVCGYSTDRLRGDERDPRLWPGVCAEHWAVCQALE